MKVRRFMPLVAAALIAVLTLALGAGTGAAKSDVQAAPAKYKVTLVTDIGGLDDRSFNFLANKGLHAREEEASRSTASVFISKSGSDYVPNLTRAARNGSGLVIGVGFLMADAVAQVAKRFPKTKFAIIDNSGVAAELKGKPTNVRGCSSRSRRPATSSGSSPRSRSSRKPYDGQTKLGAVGGLKIPPVDRYIAGYYAGAKRASSKVTVTHSYSQDFVDQAKCKEQALNQIANGAGAVFQVAGQCGLGVLSAAKEKGVFGIGVDADQGYLGPHVMTSATKKVDVAVYQTIEAARQTKCVVPARTSTPSSRSPTAVSGTGRSRPGSRRTLREAGRGGPAS